jgi:hypothetical protein
LDKCLQACTASLHRTVSYDELRAADILAVENFPETFTASAGHCSPPKVSQENSFQERINQFVEKFN